MEFWLFSVCFCHIFSTPMKKYQKPCHRILLCRLSRGCYAEKPFHSLWYGRVKNMQMLNLSSQRGAQNTPSICTGVYNLSIWKKILFKRNLSFLFTFILLLKIQMDFNLANSIIRQYQFNKHIYIDISRWKKINL